MSEKDFDPLKCVRVWFTHPKINWGHGNARLIHVMHYLPIDQRIFSKTFISFLKNLFINKGLRLVIKIIDKFFCLKWRTNESLEYRNENESIKRPMESYKRSYRALSILIKEFGGGANIRLVKAIQLGLDRKSPCLLIQLKSHEGTFSKIGNLAYHVSADLKYIQIYNVSDGTSD